MKSPLPPLTSEADTLARILAAARRLASERVPLLSARGRFAARERFAEVALPGFDNSSMDGYALPVPTGGVEEHPAGARFRVVGEQPAGQTRAGLRLAGPGEAVRIFTGAPVPEGTGAVVMQEDVDVEGDEIALREPVTSGEFIRRAGGDLARGQRVVADGEPLTAAGLALLASQGWVDVEVGRCPRVAVLTTGDELRHPGDGRGESLAPGEIYESNGVLLAALAAGMVGPENVRTLHAPDEPDRLDAALREALTGSDVTIIAGGMSVGERDLVRGRLAALNAPVDLWRVRVRPGKPFAYGRSPGENGAHVFGLPGNPVSAFVTFLLFVRPALRRLMGAGDAFLGLPSFPAEAATELTNAGVDRPHYLRGTLDESGRFHLAGRQESHALFALSRSRALVRLEADETIPAGGAVRVLLWET